MSDQERLDKASQIAGQYGDARMFQPKAFSIWCFLGIHKWTKWLEVHRQYHKSTYRHLVHQERACERCHQIQGRQEYYWITAASSSARERLRSTGRERKSNHVKPS